MSENFVYRQNVCGILIHSKHLLLCERADYPGEWQFPQGGIKSNEIVEEAFFREMNEELGIDRGDLIILKTSHKTYKYDFPNSNKRKNEPFKGQEQRFILAELEKLPVITLNYEFRSYVWIKPEFLKNFKFSFFKKDAAYAALKDLGLTLGA